MTNGGPAWRFEAGLEPEWNGGCEMLLGNCFYCKVLLQGICFRARRTGNAQNGDGLRGVKFIHTRKLDGQPPNENGAKRNPR